MGIPRLAVIGLGRMGNFHTAQARGLNKLGICELVGVCDSDISKAKAIGEKYDLSFYSNADDILNDTKPNKVVVASNSYSHFDIARKCILKGIDVLIEKPIVLLENDLEELRKLSIESKVLVSGGFTEVYNGIIHSIKHFISQGDIHFVDFFRQSILNQYNNAENIDVLFDLFVHDLAVLFEILDINERNQLKPESAIKSFYNSETGQYEAVSVILKGENGKIFRFIADRYSPINIRKIRFNLSNICGEFDYREQLGRVYKRGNIFISPEERLWFQESQESLVVRYSNNALRDQLIDFCQNSYCTGTRTSKYWYEVMKLIFAIQKIVHT